MKKTWVALAVAGVFAGAAHAQSSVTLYGLIDTYVEFASINGNSVNKLSAGGLNGSRWGMRGSEDLGGGLKGIFVLESGFNGDTGSIGQGGRLFGRTAFVGLEGGWGSFKAGRQYAPIFYTQAATDIDGYTTFSVPGNSYGQDGETLRQDNQIRYETPKFGGFQGMVSFAFGETPGNSSQNRRFGLHATWDIGPVTLAGGYHDRGIDTATQDSFAAYTLGGKAKFGAFGVAGNWSQFKLDNKVAVDNKWDQWSIGADWTMGAFTILGQYGQTKNKTSGSGSPKEDSWMFGGDYVLSKRTKVYMRYAQTDDSGSGTGTGASPIQWYGLGDITDGNKARTFAIGLNHKF